MRSSNFHNISQQSLNDSSEDDEDDLIVFQFETKTIKIYYSQLSKYSKFIRDKYMFSDIGNVLPDEIHRMQNKYNIISDNIDLFFQLLQDNFNLSENQSLSYIQYLDLLKISDYFQVKKLTKKLIKYSKIHNFDVSFIIEIIQYENAKASDNNNDRYEGEIKVNIEMEDVLVAKIDECFQNDKFKELPIPFIYRIIEKSSKNEMSTDKLYDFIKESISRFYLLFSFVSLESLSDDRLDDLFSIYESSKKEYFTSLPCNLEFIKKLRESERSLNGQKKQVVEERNGLQEKLDECEKENVQLKSDIVKFRENESKLQKKLSDSEQEKNQLQTKLTDVEQMKNQMISNNDQLKTEKGLLQKKLNDSEQEKSRLQKKLTDVEQEKIVLKNKIEEIEKCSIEGAISAKVTNGCLINAEIKLAGNQQMLDTSRSKYIVSTSNEKEIGARAYEGGEVIKSFNETTKSFSRQSGTYYVRALVVDMRGSTREIVSNPVKVLVMTFGYEGKSREIVLEKGKYKLEVWGAQGGNSAGRGTGSHAIVPRGKGGLGGYSVGQITLSEKTKFFIYVGGEGKSAQSGDGMDTSGSFPDGGGTKTGHCSDYTSVPGTGGGSTSVRVKSDSLYSRVIVAGGGGGAGGDGECTDHGGFGGGASGGNSYACGSLRDRGAGTQTGSTPGPKGSGPEGVAGTFGQGATGLYHTGRDSGGGGGGGWYGGGSGGYGGDTNCASGGGGSGWIFTKESFSAWKSGDSQKAGRFELDSAFYLSDARTVPGNASFPDTSGSGSETGHSGNGFAKITPL